MIYTHSAEHLRVASAARAFRSLRIVPVACLDFHLHIPCKDIPEWDLFFLDCVVLTLVLADCTHCNAHHVVQRETIIMPALIRLTRQGVGLQ